MTNEHVPMQTSAEQIKQSQLDRDRFQSKFLAVFSAVVFVSLLGFLAALLVLGGTVDNPMAMMIAGAVLQGLGTVLGYWYGSSAGSKRAADRLADVVMKEENNNGQ